MHGVCAGALIMSLAAGASAFCSMPCSISAGIAAASSCATRQPLPMLRESLLRGGAAMTAKKKKGAKKKDNGGVSVSEDSEDAFDGGESQKASLVRLGSTRQHVTTACCGQCCRSATRAWRR